MNDKIMSFYDKEAKIYDDKRFSSIAGKYSDFVHKEIVFNFNNSWRDKLILDVGCGTGRFSTEIAKKGAKVLALDFSNAMLNILEQKSASLGLEEKIYPIRADARAIPIKEASVDGCICINFIQLVNSYKEVISEISRVLKPDGILIINFPNLLGWYFPVGMYVNITKKSIQKDVHSRWFTLEEIKKLFSMVGLKITDVRGYLYFPANTPKFLFKLFNKIDKISRDSILKYLSSSLFVKAIKLEEDL